MLFWGSFFLYIHTLSVWAWALSFNCLVMWLYMTSFLIYSLLLLHFTLLFFLLFWKSGSGVCEVIYPTRVVFIFIFPTAWIGRLFSPRLSDVQTFRVYIPDPRLQTSDFRLPIRRISFRNTKQNQPHTPDSASHCTLVLSRPLRLALVVADS